MSGQATITVVGNIGADPIVRQTTSGAVTSFTVATTRRVKQSDTGAYVDGHTSWYRVSAFGQLGANAAESLRKGERVIVTGNVSVRTWMGDGEVERKEVEILADHVGHDLRFGSSRFTKVVRSVGQQAGPSDTPEPAMAGVTTASANSGWDLPEPADAPF